MNQIDEGDGQETNFNPAEGNNSMQKLDLGTNAGNAKKSFVQATLGKIELAHILALFLVTVLVFMQDLQSMVQ